MFWLSNIMAQLEDTLGIIVGDRREFLSDTEISIIAAEKVLQRKCAAAWGAVGSDDYRAPFRKHQDQVALQIERGVAERWCKRYGACGVITHKRRYIVMGSEVYLDPDSLERSYYEDGEEVMR